MELWERVPHRDMEMTKGQEHFYEESLRALTQVPKRGCEVFFPGDLQKLSGHGAGQPALGGPA